MSLIKLSILIPTYNYQNGLNQILKSLNNTNLYLFNFIEIVISDDSEKKILSFKEYQKLKNKYINFKYIHNKIPLGGPKNWNKLIDTAKGDYIWILHHDEYWETGSNLIKNIIEILNKKNPNAIILPIIKKKEILIKNKKLEVSQKHLVFKDIYKRFIVNPKLLIRLNTLGPPSALIYRKKNFYYDENLKYFVDVEFYMRLFKGFVGEKIIIIKHNNFNLISSQNNKFAITNYLKKDIKKIKLSENFYISKKLMLKYNYLENIFLMYSYLILKLCSLISTKIIIRN